MPKSTGKRRVYTTPNGKPDPKDVLRHRKSVQEQELDERRSRLLVEILNVSTQLSIDESSSLASARQAAQDHGALFDLIDDLRATESKLNPELPRRDESSWRKFFEWIEESSRERQEPAKTSDDNSGSQEALSSRIGVRAALESANGPLLGEDEFSLITKVPIKSGEKVFAVDRHLMLTTETATRDVDLDDFIRNDMIASGMQNVVLVLHLLNEYSKRERSHWWPYLSILPRRLLPILRLNKAKLNRHLLASAHIFEALRMFRAIARQYTYFHKRLQSTKLPLKRDFTFEYYAWGVSIVCSRQNEIPQRRRAREQQQQLQSPVVHALIPLLDMCNHNLHSNQAIYLNDTSCLVTLSDLAPNQEITINYGNRSSGDFYIHNGFVPDQVPSDVVPLTIALANDDLLAAKTRLLKLLNMPTSMGRFKLSCNKRANRHRRDPHLTMFLIVYCLEAPELELLMSSENLVAIADYIYDYIQYKMDEEAQQPNGAREEEPALGAEVDKMKMRLAKCYKDYLARRAGVCIALIDRALKELTLEQNGGQQQAAEGRETDEHEDDKLYAIRLLQREREIYASYVEDAKQE